MDNQESLFWIEFLQIAGLLLNGFAFMLCCVYLADLLFGEEDDD